MGEFLLLQFDLQSQRASRVRILNREANIPKVRGDQKSVEAKWEDNGNCGKIPIDLNTRQNPPGQEMVPLPLAHPQAWETI